MTQATPFSEPGHSWRAARSSCDCAEAGAVDRGRRIPAAKPQGREATKEAPPPSRFAELGHREFRRILLIKPSSLGDIIHALPVLHGLRRRYPQAKIDWLVSNTFAPLLNDHPDLDEVIPFQRRRFGRMAKSPLAGRDFFRFVRDLRRRRYDLVIDLQGLFRTGFLAWATGATARMGFRAAREGASLFYTHAIVCPDANQHAVDRNRLLLRELVGSALSGSLPKGCREEPPQFSLNIGRNERENAANLLRPLTLASPRHIIAIAPGARWETKTWPAASFVATIDGLQRDEQVACLLLGGPDEVEGCAAITSACARPPLNLAGQTDLRTLVAVVERADLVLCLDSGVMHIAAALGKPLVCLTGPTNPHRTGPYGRIHDVIRLDLACSPCYLRRLRQCHFGHRCMGELSPDSVIEASLARMRNTACGRAKL